MLQKIPIALIYTRLLLGFGVVLLAIFQPINFQFWEVMLLTLGLLSDIFDGIIARKIGVSSQTLRRLDSTIDQIFFISVAVAAYLQCPTFFKENWIKLSTLISAEVLTYVISFLKFRKEIATHSIGAKFWTLLLFATLVQILLQCQSGVFFELCFWIGILTRIEIMAIILVLKNWTNDVPSVYHALQLRNGRTIKRNKMFNG